MHVYCTAFPYALCSLHIHLINFTYTIKINSTLYHIHSIHIIYRCLAEQDLLGSTSSSSTSDHLSSTPSSPPPYELRNTGQGLQRVQQSPLVYRAMHEILARTKHQLGGWVGSSVIHLGDNNVPNTLMFIDKYTQVPRILGPLIKTLENLEQACSNNEGLNRYMLAYGGIDKAKKVYYTYDNTILLALCYFTYTIIYYITYTCDTRYTKSYNALIPYQHILYYTLYYTLIGHTTRLLYPRVRRQRRGQLLRRRQLHRRQTHLGLELVSCILYCMCILLYVYIIIVYKLLLCVCVVCVYAILCVIYYHTSYIYHTI